MMEHKKKKDNLSRRIKINNLLGIHARPAAKIAKIATDAKQNVWLSKNSNKVDAKSIIDILSLGAPKGTNIIIEIETLGDIKILNSLFGIIESGFGEEK